MASSSTRLGLAHQGDREIGSRARFFWGGRSIVTTLASSWMWPKNLYDAL